MKFRGFTWYNKYTDTLSEFFSTSQSQGEEFMQKKFEELTISDDFMFGIIMRQSEYCKPFLETILGIKIEHIEYPKTQETIDLDLRAKSVRLDVYVDDAENTVYNIEMQNSSNPNLPKRSRYYQDMIDLNILDKGCDYEELKNGIVIFVCTFDPFGQGRHYYSFENVCLEDSSLKLNDGTKKILLNTKGILDDVNPRLKKLLDFIDGQQPEDEFTQELSIAVESAKHSKKWRLEYMNLELKLRDKYREGIKDCAQESAKRMLADGNLSIDKIALYTGLSTEQIRTLQNSMKAESTKVLI